MWFLRVCIVTGLLAALSAQAAEGPGFPVAGKIAPRHARDIKSSTWSIGGETLDRDFAIYENYKSYLGPLGAKAIRVQTGWAKIEKKPGVYDFKWLDDVVNDAISQGVRPWLETNYGNPLYPGGGGIGLGDGIPSSPEALAAWDKWVAALVGRFKDRVNEWEVWNEPDLGKDAPAEPYGDLFIRTAEIIRSQQPDAKIYALGLAGKMDYADRFLAHVQKKGKLELITAITIHGYPQNPDDTSNVDKARAMVAKYSATIQVRQGETGCPSTFKTSGALRNLDWTSELTQAKWDLRRMLAHRAKDVPFSLFTLMEFNYTSGKTRGLNTKGILKSREDMTVEYAKPAYFAAQNAIAVFDDTVVRVKDFAVTTTTTQKIAVDAYAKDGKQILAAWFNGAIPSNSNDTTPVDITLPRGQFQEPVYADLRTGMVYAIPKANIVRAGGQLVLKQIPVYDSPILIAEKSALPIKAAK